MGSLHKFSTQKDKTAIYRVIKTMNSSTFYKFLSLIALVTLRECCAVKGVNPMGDLAVNDLPKSFPNPSVQLNGEFNATFAKDIISASVEEELKAELEEDPFKQWEYKSKWRQMSDLKLNGELMSKAIQPGDEGRLKKVLIKALEGQQINLLVIGGSNSAGGNLGVDEKSLDGLYFKVFSNWWNNTFGKVTKAFVKEYQVTIGGTGSYFFAFCYRTFIPKDKKIDIVLIETSINYNLRGKAEAYEQLTRQVLEYPSAPAVLYINLVSGLGLDSETNHVINPSCINLENFGQAELTRHYDITSFSLKEVLCRKENDQWRAVITDEAASDGRHIGIKAHAMVAMMMIEYIRGVLKEAVEEAKNTFGDSKVYSVIDYSPIPEPFFLRRETEALKQPLCWTGVTPDIFQDLHRPNLQIKIEENEGFSPSGSFRDQNASDKGKNSNLRTDAQGGWGTWQIYSSLKLRIYVSPINSSPNTRSVILLTRTSGSGGKAKVWLDNNDKEAIYINTKSMYGQNRLDSIQTRVEPGFHTIMVRTVCEGNFLVSGVLVGPPDFERRKVL